MNAPVVIRVELEGLKRQLVAALDDYHGEWETILREEIERVLSPDFVRATVAKQVVALAENALRKSVEDSLRYVVVDVVSERLREFAQKEANRILDASLQASKVKDGGK